jgi:ATP-dependent Lhr-like helicase
MAAAPGALSLELEVALWDLVWAGQITNDTFAPLRALAGPRRVSARRPGRPAPTLAGRWSLVRDLIGASVDTTVAAHARALMLLERYGIVMREAVIAEDVPGGFSAVATVLRAMEEAGRVRRGYFIEGPAGMQFALPGAIDRLRAARPTTEAPLVLSAIDPANPFGLFLDWPATDDEGRASRPRRVAGAIVVTVGFRPALFLEKGGRKLTLFPAGPDSSDPIGQALHALVAACKRQRRTLRITEINGCLALRSPRAGQLERCGFRVEPGGLVCVP